MNHARKVYDSLENFWVIELRNCDHNTCSDWRRKVLMLAGDSLF